MASSFGKESLPSDYLHFWWNHYDGGNAFFAQRYFVSKKAILSNQLQQFYLRKKKKMRSLSRATGISTQVFSDMYDDLLENPKLLSGDLPQYDIVQQQKKSDVSSIEEALNIVNGVDTWLDSLNKGARSLYEAATLMTSPEAIKAWAESVLDDYIMQAVEAETFATTGNQQADRSRAAMGIISDFRNKRAGRNELFDVPDTIPEEQRKNEQLLNRYQRKILALIYAVGTIQSTPGAAQSLMGGTKEEQGKIARQWMMQCKGLIANANGAAHEVASAVAMLKAAKEFFDKDDELYRMILSQKNIGGTYIKIEKNFRENEAWKKLKTLSNKSMGTINTKRAKSDAELVLNFGKTEVSFLRGTAKYNLGYYPSDPLAKKGAYLNIHHNANFLNFLVREMGMNGQDLHSMVQMLVGRAESGEGATLESQWELLKENVAYNGFLNALAGYAREEQADYMQIGDRIVPIEKILQSAQEGTVDPASSYSPDYSRKDFLSASSWEMPSRPNWKSAFERSERAWLSASTMLTSMVLNIKMNITSNFITTYLK